MRTAARPAGLAGLIDVFPRGAAMMTTRRSMFLPWLCVAVAAALPSAAAAAAQPPAPQGPAALADKYVQAIEQIRSYDAMLSVESVAYPDAQNAQSPANRPVVTTTETVRDVLAIGRGRRVEHSIGVPAGQYTSAITWAAASNGPKPLAVNLSANTPPGQGLSDYFNPNLGGIFLADALRSSEGAVRAIAPYEGDAALPGLEVTHPSLRGPVRVWLDSRAGYMPRRIEQYLRDGKGTRPPALWDLTTVEEFAHADGAWVPVKGRFTQFTPFGPLAGRAYAGAVVVADRDHSAWNAITSDELFLPQSVASANNDAGGWTQHYPPAILPAIQRANALAGGSGFGGFGRAILVAASAAAILAAALALALWKRRASRHLGGGGGGTAAAGAP